MNRFAHGVAAPPQRGVLRRSLGSVLVLALAGGAQLATAGPCNQVSYNPDLVEQASPGIHTSTFVDEVVLGMADSQVKGYVATLTNARGEIVVEIEQGQARTLCDPGGQRAFDVGTQTPWGSVSKLITTAAAARPRAGSIVSQRRRGSATAVRKRRWTSPKRSASTSGPQSALRLRI